MIKEDSVNDVLYMSELCTENHKIINYQQKRKSGKLPEHHKGKVPKPYFQLHGQNHRELLQHQHPQHVF